MVVKKRKRRLTKFGKVFFLSVFLIGFLSIGLFKHTSRNFYEKEETDNYLLEIKYPNLENKKFLAYTDNYINSQKEEFMSEIGGLEGIQHFQYEFKTDYDINDNNNITSVHLDIMKYTGGAHSIRDKKSYYFDNYKNELLTIKDFLEDEKSLDKLSNISYYYVMKSSEDNGLSLDKEWLKEGLSNNPDNFEHFNFLDAGLEIIFPHYQVAYYAAGEIKIVIPYNELNGVIKTEYLKYSQNNNNEYKNERNLKEFSNKKLIAFTFDDGPSYIATNKLLDNLDKYNARVTFFVMGNRVNDYSDTLTRAYKMGNVIGSHTFSHPNLHKLDDYEIANEIKKTNENIRNILGQDTIYLRPPYGNTNDRIKNVANMYNILWDLDTEDWKYKDKNRITDYIVTNAHDGAIVLLHDLYETSVDGALLAMERLEKEGYAFVTIEEMALLKNISLDKSKSYYQLIS